MNLKNHPLISSLLPANWGLRAMAAAFLLAAALIPVHADDATNGPTVITPGKNTTRTVGLDIAKRTVNPDKTTSLTFKWSEKGKQFERTVVANDKTIVVYNGAILKLSDQKVQLRPVVICFGKLWS